MSRSGYFGRKSVEGVIIKINNTSFDGWEVDLRFSESNATCVEQMRDVSQAH